MLTLNSCSVILLISQHIHDQVAINIIPRAFVVDDNHAIQNPLGILGNELTLHAQKATASSSLVYNLINVAELAGI